jgi:heptosyltransferase-2
MAVTSFCDAIIGNEGGAINMAKALDVPSFAVFSPFIPKGNWFGDKEKSKHSAVHLKDYLNIPEKEARELKKRPQVYYERFKPEFIMQELNRFLDKIAI